MNLQKSPILLHVITIGMFVEEAGVETKTLGFQCRAKCQKGTANTTTTTTEEVTLEEGVGSGVLQQQPNVPMSYRNARKPGILWLVLEYLEEICLPLLVLVLGFFCSVAALTTL